MTELQNFGIMLLIVGVVSFVVCYATMNLVEAFGDAFKEK